MASCRLRDDKLCFNIMGCYTERMQSFPKIPKRRLGTKAIHNPFARQNETSQGVDPPSLFLVTTESGTPTESHSDIFYLLQIRETDCHASAMQGWPHHVCEMRAAGRFRRLNGSRGRYIVLSEQACPFIMEYLSDRLCRRTWFVEGLT